MIFLSMVHTNIANVRFFNKSANVLFLFILHGKLNSSTTGPSSISPLDKGNVTIYAGYECIFRVL